MMLVALPLFGLAVVAAAPAGAQDNPETHRAPESETMDRPTPPIRVVIPSGESEPGTGTQNPGLECDMPEIPEEITEEPPQENPDPGDFWGEPVFGRIVWVLDRSGSMGASDSGSGPIEMPDGSNIANPTRLQVVKAETIRTISALAEDDEFALVTFGANPDVDYSPAMVKATAGNKQEGISKVQTMVASGGTPAYPALQRACSQYGADVTKFFFLSDGAPNVGGGAAQILADFPEWYQPLRDEGCSLVCILVGNSGAAMQFMQALANQNGGTFITR
jgi:hypothetical protein